MTVAERARFNGALRQAQEKRAEKDEAYLEGLRALDYRVFLAEANEIGYAPAGQLSERNDLYAPDRNGLLASDQTGTILGELERFRGDPQAYDGHRSPDCAAMGIAEMWKAHDSRRLDPKYHLFKLEESMENPPGWVRLPIDEVMRRRESRVRPEKRPEDEVTVLTISQTGEIRAREAGKGRNPPEWLGMYFEDMPTKWYGARAGDVVFSGIDLWKGCIAVVPEEFDGGLVSSEFPVYEITDERLAPEFVSTLLRTRYYRRAFRAITTGHSNRRRTQVEDFEDLEIPFPPDREEQRRLIQDVIDARSRSRDAGVALREAMVRISDLIDQRGDEELLDDVDEAEA